MSHVPHTHSDMRQAPTAASVYAASNTYTHAYPTCVLAVAAVAAAVPPPPAAAVATA